MKRLGFISKNRWIAVFLLAILAVLVSTCKKKSEPEESVSEGTLTLHESGVRIVTLKGSYYEMGLHYGKLLREDLHTWANYYDSIWKHENPVIYDFITKRVVEGGNRLYVSDRIKDFLLGEEYASGLSKVQVYLLAQCLTFDYMFSGKIDSLGGAACTFVGAYGEATGGRTIVARNLDLQKPLAVSSYNNVITIMHPTNGDHKIATFGFVGFPQGYALMNLDDIVFTEYNTGNASDAGSDPYFESRDMMDVAFDAVTHKANTDALSTARYIQNQRILSPSFLGVADRQMVYVVQRPMHDTGYINQNSLGNCINGVTNIFLDSTINKVKLTIYNASTAVDAPEKGLDTPARGMVRWVNLVHYFTDHPANLDINSMKTIISTNIADSGVFITGYETPGTNTFCEDDATFGSVVIDLSDLSNVNWLRYNYATQSKNWDVIDLTQYIH